LDYGRATSVGGSDSEAVVLEKGDQVAWMSDAGNLRVEFDVNRCPFGSNVFQARQE